MVEALEISQKYAIGQPVSRDEDPRLLRGEGRYVDDINLSGQRGQRLFLEEIKEYHRKYRWNELQHY